MITKSGLQKRTKADLVKRLQLLEESLKNSFVINTKKAAAELKKPKDEYSAVFYASRVELSLEAEAFLMSHFSYSYDELQALLKQ